MLEVHEPAYISCTRINFCLYDIGARLWRPSGHHFSPAGAHWREGTCNPKKKDTLSVKKQEIRQINLLIIPRH